MYDPVTQTLSPAPGLEKRVNIVEEVGTIYRDPNGVTRTMLVFQITEALLQAFDNSGFNLAKAILAELLQYGRDNNFANQVRRNLWDATFDANSRIMNGLSYMSLAITSRGSVDGLVGVTLLLQSWLEQANKYVAVKQVSNALSINKRSTQDSILESRDFFPSPWCASDRNIGFYHAAVPKGASAVDIKTGCPAAN